MRLVSRYVVSGHETHIMEQNCRHSDMRGLLDEVSVHDRFDILGDLGGGAYGTVYKAKDRENGGNIVALKKISVQEDPDVPGYPPFVMREIANLNRLSSSPENNIVR